jgi:hypothetical protein
MLSCLLKYKELFEDLQRNMIFFYHRINGISKSGLSFVIVVNCILMLR